MKAIIMLFFINNPVQTYTDICDENTDHLKYNDKISFYIGCSTVDGSRVYSTRKLEGILENR